MADRMHLVLETADKERYRRCAERAGQTLSEWLRAAAEAKAAAEAAPALDSPASLRAFFADCDARETGQEPDWELQRALVEESMRHGATGT
jgi:hypothetical protein